MDFTDPRKTSRRFAASALGLLLLLSLGLRLWGVTYGLPHSYILDETFVVNHSLAFGTGDLNPHFFEWPGSLLMYVLFGLYGIYFLCGLIVGSFRNPEDFALSFLSDPTAFYLIGRTFTAVVSTATVYVAYLLAKKWYDERTGLAAALLLGVSPLLSGVSHFTLTDTPLAFLCVAAFIPLCNAAERGRLRDYFWGGLLIGLAAAVKYNAAALLLPLAAAHAVFVWREPGMGPRALLFDRRVVVAGVAVLAGFVLGCPFSVLDHRKFLSDILFQFSRVHSLGNINAEFDSPLLFYLKVGLGEGIGIGVTILCLLGIIRAGFRRKPADLVILSFILGYFLYISRWKVAVDKYLIPVIPLLVIIGSAFFSDLYRQYAAGSRVGKIAGLSFLGLLVAIPLQRALQTDYTLVQQDTRDLAKAWIEQNIPPGTKIAIDSGRFDVAKLSPPLDDSPENLYSTYVGAGNDADNRFARSGGKILRRYYELKLKSSSARAYPLSRIVISSEGKIDRNVSVDGFLRSGVRYVVVSSFAYEGYSTEAYRNNHPEAAAFYSDFYRSLGSRFTLVKEFTREPDKRQGPTIRIYRVPSV